MKPILRAFLLSGLLLPALRPQVAKQANKNYQTPEGRSKVAKSLSDPHRADELKPKELIAQLDIKPGSTIADVGTGVGVFLSYLSEAVGPSGWVIAEDIVQDFLDKAQERIK